MGVKLNLDFSRAGGGEFTDLASHSHKVRRISQFWHHGGQKLPVVNKEMTSRKNRPRDDFLPSEAKGNQSDAMVEISISADGALKVAQDDDLRYVNAAARATRRRDVPRVPPLLGGPRDVHANIASFSVSVVLPAAPERLTSSCFFPPCRLVVRRLLPEGFVRHHAADRPNAPERAQEEKFLRGLMVFFVVALALTLFK